MQNRLGSKQAAGAPAAFFADHPGQKRPRQIKNAVQIDPHHPAPILVCDILKQLLLRDPRVIDQYVHRAALRLHGFGKFGRLFRVGQIRLQRLRLRPLFAQSARQPLRLFHTTLRQKTNDRGPCFLFENAGKIRTGNT